MLASSPRCSSPLRVPARCGRLWRPMRGSSANASMWQSASRLSRRRTSFSPLRPHRSASRSRSSLNARRRRLLRRPSASHRPRPLRRLRPLLSHREPRRVALPLACQQRPRRLRHPSASALRQHRLRWRLLKLLCRQRQRQRPRRPSPTSLTPRAVRCILRKVHGGGGLSHPQIKLRETDDADGLASGGRGGRARGGVASGSARPKF